MEAPDELSLVSDGMSGAMSSFGNVLTQLDGEFGRFGKFGRTGGAYTGGDANVGVQMSAQERIEALDSGLMGRILSFYPSESTKLPLKFLDHEGQDNSELEPYKTALTILDQIGAYNSFRDALFWTQVNKRHYLVIGRPSDPIEAYASPIDRIDELTRLRSVGIDELTRMVPIMGSQQSKKDTPYTLSSTKEASSFSVHPSRVICFEDGIHSCLSFLEQVYPAVAALESLYPQLSEVVRSYSTPTIGIDNLTATLAKKNQGRGMSGRERVMERIRLWRMSLNIFNAAVYDRRTEEVAHLERSAQSLDIAYKPLINRVVSLSGIPESMLFLVRQSGGALNDSGTRESMIAAQITQQMQRNIYPQWQQLLRLILPEDGEADLDTLSYQSTVVLSEAEAAEVEHKKAQAEKERQLADKAKAETHLLLCELAAKQAEVGALRPQDPLQADPTNEPDDAEPSQQVSEQQSSNTPDNEGEEGE